jgi:hypothetical protein
VEEGDEAVPHAEGEENASTWRGRVHDLAFLLMVWETLTVHGGPTPSPPPPPHPSLPPTQRPMHPTPSAVAWKNVADRLLHSSMTLLELVPESGWDLAPDGGGKKSDSTVSDGEAEAEA